MRAAVACALGAWLASCSDGGDAASSSRARRIALALDVARPPATIGTSLERLDPPIGLAPWQVGGDGAAAIELVEGEDGARAVLLPGAGGFVLRVPVRQRACDFDRVALSLSSARGARVQLRFVGRFGELPDGPTVSVSGGDEPQVVFLDVPWSRFSEDRVDMLVLRVRSEGGRNLLHRVELFDRVLADWLPSPGNDELVAIAGDSRRAVGLASGERLRARFVPEADDVLSMSYGVPVALATRSDAPPVLSVSLRAAGGGSLQRDVMLGGAQLVGAWHALELPLDDFAGREVELALTLTSNSRRHEVCALELPRLRRPDARAQSVLLVTSDTHRADHLGAAQLGVEVRTPALDALAAQGTLFTDCFSTANVTVPSHVTLLTGRHPRDHGVLDNQTRLADTAETLAERFRAAGYVTIAAVGHAQLGHERGGLGQGFDRMAIPRDGKVADASEGVATLDAWLPELDGLPLFCWLHVFDAHEPYLPPDPRFVELYYPAGRNPFNLRAPPLKDVPLSSTLVGLRDIEWPRACYRAEVSYLDEQLGRLFATPRFDAGLVAVTADHGESLGAHGIWFSHADLYPDSLHVPLLLRGEGVPRGVRIERPVQQRDLGRTLLDLAGLEHAVFPGANLLREPAGRDPRFALAANGVTASITLDGWHLILQLRDNASPHMLHVNERHGTRLFDLAADPACLDDFVARDAELERARRLRGQLIAWLAAAEELGWVGPRDERPEVQAELAGLGYTIAAAAASADELFDEACECAWCERLGR